MKEDEVEGKEEEEEEKEEKEDRRRRRRSPGMTRRMVRPIT